MRSTPRVSCVEMSGQAGRVAPVLCSAVLLAFSVVALAAEHPSSAPESRHSKQAAGKAQCEQWRALQACDVSWYRLLASPEAYRGKIVRLTGYLVSDFGDLIFYPDKANYEEASEIDSVVLERPFTISKAIADKAASGVSAVVVMGRFKPMDGVEHLAVPRAGTIYDIQKIASSPRVPSGTPLNTDGIRVQSPGY